MNTPDPERMAKSRLESINIINALRRGTVPAGGLERIAVGLDVEEGVIAKQLEYVEQGGGDLKFIRGEYGSGKTFLVARALEIARTRGFVTSHVVIAPSTPLHKLKGIYQQVCANLRTSGEEHAMKTIVDNWLFGIEERLLSVSGNGTEDAVLETATEREIETALSGISEMNSALAATLRTYYRANNTGDFTLAQAALGWISAEPNIGRELKQKAGIRGDIDDTIAFTFLRGLVSIIHAAGYRGLAIAIDEMETTQGLQRNQREKAYQTLVRIIDALDRGDMPRCYFLFTGTPALFEGSRGIRSLPPLYDRINVVQSDAFKNPRQPQIILSKFDTAKLELVALKVVDVYARAYTEPDRERISHRFIRAMIRKITTRFGGRVDIIPRIFLKEFVDILDKCELYENYNPHDTYDFDTEHIKGELKKEEEAVMVVTF
ncbi:MAG: BREX system ATP-binding protein BrxD [Methanoregula sp.]|uniref:BREX system ATP-binding protein BrxD n=1 Tax=Methanoregula sp. TaxID=2052170 RepID=UPI0025F60B30|nr:BREX system ATP-binding protein BrxD [Methanoregula sp.]MCK9630555.1 BREX system ATP-binding protein BrxD [Methanoregula sp.]